jgi:ribosomal-protein-alanine N-acetyltransferase
MSKLQSAIPVSFRPATVDDLAELARIEKAIHVAPWGEDQFRAELDKPYSRVLLLTDDETDTQIAGYVVFWLMFDEAQILDIAVDLPHRGLGHGKRMIRQVVTEALRKDIRRVVLDVRKGNAAAIALYQSMRFTIAQIRKGFYSNGEDAYTMVLDLDLSGMPEEVSGF